MSIVASILAQAPNAATAPHAVWGGISPAGVSMVLIFAIIGIALVFDFLNGFHDAANSIATIVSTRVLSPTQAVIWAAIFNFLAVFFFGTKVSETISGKLMDTAQLSGDVYVIFAGL